MKKRQKLEEKINKFSSFIRKHEDYIKIFSITAITAGFLCMWAKNVPDEIRRVKTIKQKERDKEVIMELPQEFRKEYTEKLQEINAYLAKDPDEIYPMRKDFYKYMYGFLSLVVMGMYLEKRKMMKNSSFIPEYNNFQKITKRGLQLVGGSATTAYIFHSGMFKYSDNLTRALTLPAMFFIGTYFAETYHMRHLQKKHAKKAEKENNLDDKIYLYYKMNELQEELSKDMKNKKYEDAVQKTRSLIKLLGKLDDNEKRYVPGTFNIFLRYQHLFNHMNATVNPDFENSLKLLISGARQYSRSYEMTLEKTVERCNEHNLELRLIDYEFTTDKIKKKEKAKEIHKRLVRQKAYDKPNKESANVIEIAKCGLLKRVYAEKRLKQDELEEEVRQTEEIRKAFRNDRNIIIPEIVETFNENELEDMQEAALWMGYIDAKPIAETLANMDSLDDKIKLYEMLVKADVKASRYGIIDEEVDLQKKAEDDIRRNPELEGIAQELIKNITFCFDFAELFEKVYDVDSYLPNRLGQNILNNDGKLVMLDWETRKKSDIMYMGVKKFEYGDILPIAEADGETRRIAIASRKHLVKLHMNSLGYYLKDIQQMQAYAHYFGSVPLKAISFNLYSRGKKGTEELSRAYFKSADFALTVLSNEFKEMYTTERIRMIENTRECLRSLPIME